MAAKLPKAWFPSTWGASIRLRPVDKWAELHEKHCPHFNTWEEAHSWLVSDSLAKLALALKEMESSRKRLEKALSLTPAQQGEERADAA